MEHSWQGVKFCENILNLFSESHHNWPSYTNGAPNRLSASDFGCLEKPVRTCEDCGSPPGVMMADTLSFNAKIGVVDF